MILFATRHPDGGQSDADADELNGDDLAAFEREGLEPSLSARWCIGIVLDATGVSLTAGWDDEEQERISPERVRAMAADLEAADLEQLARRWRADPDSTDVLLRWFRACSDRGLGVRAL